MAEARPCRARHLRGAMISLGFVDILMGAMFGGIAIVSLRDRRYGNALFWALWALTLATLAAKMLLQTSWRRRRRDSAKI